MNGEWQSFLTDAGAVIASGQVENFSVPREELEAALNEDIIADISHFGMIRAEGEDTRDFLQGQFTNDVRQVDETHSKLGSYCNPKGRMLAVFRLFQREGAYFLRLPEELVSPLLKRLRMYVLRSKVVLDDVGDALGRFGISGPNAPALLQTALSAVPSSIDESIQSEGVTVIQVPGIHPRFELYGEPAQLKTLWEKLQPAAKPVGAKVWGWLEIQAGIPNVYSPTVEAFVPQMANLHLIDGVSFRKGCYTGQEIVARMQYLGKLKRRMYLAHVDSPDRPLPGAELYCSASESGQGTGKIVDSQPSPQGGYDLLAVINIADVESGRPIQIENSEGSQLAFLDLPYSTSTEQEPAGS